jgi:thymidylate kinase
MLSIKKRDRIWTATSLAAWHTFCVATTMTVSEALAILESAALECKKRDINTPEVTEALNLLEPHIQPPWLIPQFRYYLDLDPSVELDKQGQQQVLCATFPGIRDSVKELVRKQMDRLAREFSATHDMTVKDEIERLAREYGKLKEPWVFRP